MGKGPELSLSTTLPTSAISHSSHLSLVGSWLRSLDHRTSSVLPCAHTEKLCKGQLALTFGHVGRGDPLPA
jgi:hypothetical protein